MKNENSSEDYNRTKASVAGLQSSLADNGGLRYDAGKPEFHLLPVDGMREIGAVYSFGAKKYEPRNWERGMAWSRCYNSLLRHLYAFWDGEVKDPETGLHHMAHCAWNAIALLVYSLRGIGVDDRKQPVKTPTELYKDFLYQQPAGAIIEVPKNFNPKKDIMDPRNIDLLIPRAVPRYTDEGPPENRGMLNPHAPANKLKAMHKCIHCPADAQIGKDVCFNCEYPSGSLPE